jgi:hypothetical protein
MRWDICRVIESDCKDILTGQYVYIPNGLAEKAKDIYDWKRTSIEDKSGETYSFWMLGVKDRKYPCLWTDNIGVGNDADEAREWDNRRRYYVVTGEYDEKADVFRLKIKDNNGVDALIVLQIIKEKSFCLYHGEDALNLYRLYSKLSKDLLSGSLYDLNKE